MKISFFSNKIILCVQLLISICLLAACGGTNTPSAANSVSRPSGSTPTSASIPSVKTTIHLTHQPMGTADLSWSAQNHSLVVKVSLTGLAPNSTHPNHIHMGSCTNDGKVVYPLTNVVANAKGAATATTTIQGVTGGIPATGWYINIHNGPDMMPADQAMPISCGNINNTNTSTTADQTAHVTLADAHAPNQSVNGTAQLTLSGTALTVAITLNGLVPQSTHMAHIHDGSCTSQGKVAYNLQPVVADASGVGHSTTTVTLTSSLPSLPASGLYINVHLAPNMDGLSTQTGFDPVACGNITLA